MKRDELILRWIWVFLTLGDGNRPAAVGRANAIPRRVVLGWVNKQMRSVLERDELKRWQEVTDVEMRRIYANSYRGICGCEDGLYLAANREDVDIAETYLKKKFYGILRRIARLRKCYVRFGPYERQLKLFVDDDGGEAIE